MFEVYPLDVARLRDLYLELSVFPFMSDVLPVTTRESFEDVLVDKSTLIFDINNGQGLALVLKLRVFHDAEVYFIMHDRRLRGREELCAGLVQFLMDRLQLVRLSTSAASDFKVWIKFVERLGFRHEGRVKFGVQRGSRYIDKHLFGYTNHSLLAAAGQGDYVADAPSHVGRNEQIADRLGTE